MSRPLLEVADLVRTAGAIFIEHSRPWIRWQVPDSKGGFMDTGNYRKRVLHKLARDLGLPKLTFQVIRRTIATLAQKKGTVKDVQGLLRHSRAATTTDVYMQEIPESVRGTINAIHAELRLKPETA
jgi:integrase